MPATAARRYGDWTQAKRDRLPALDFAGPHQSFPIQTQKDVYDAARLIGHADDPAAVKRRIKAIARRKGFDLPDSWQDEDEERAAAEPSDDADTSMAHLHAHTHTHDHPHVHRDEGGKEIRHSHPHDHAHSHEHSHDYGDEEEHEDHAEDDDGHAHDHHDAVHSHAHPAARRSTEDDEDGPDDDKEDDDDEDDEEDDDDEDGDEDAEGRRRQADQPSSAGVHTDAPIGSTGDPGTSRPRRRTRYFHRLMTALGGRLGGRGAVTREEVEGMLKDAHAEATRHGIRRAARLARSTPVAEDARVAAEGDQGPVVGGATPSTVVMRCAACRGGDCAACAGGACQCQHTGGGPSVPVASGSSGLARTMREPDPIVSDAGERFALFLPAQFGEGQWVPCLPTPGSFQHAKYGSVQVTRERNAAIVGNVNSRVYGQDIPVDAEHDLKASGALGWIRRLRLNEDGSADAHVDWNPRGQTMIAEDRFRYVSPEWYESWRAPDTGAEHKHVLIGLALTRRPFFKEGALRPLVASETGYSTLEDAASDARSGGREEAMPEYTAERFADLEAQNRRFEEQLRSSEAQAHQAIERVAFLEVERQRRIFTEEALERQINADGWVELMEALPSHDLREQVKAFVDPLITQRNMGGLFESYGRAGRGAPDVEAQVDGLVAKRRAEAPSLTREQAYAEVIEAHPDLYERIIAADR
jgi:hypothetical protein